MQPRPVPIARVQPSPQTSNQSLNLTPEQKQQIMEAQQRVCSA